MKQPLISIIIPFYNEEKYLSRAVNSILNQTYSNIEIVLIDDGSSDKSNDIASRICKENDNCRLIEIQNSGPGTARNIGLKNSIGEFVTFLDADDEYQKETFQKLYSNLISKGSDLSVCMYSMIDSNRKKIKDANWFFPEVINADLARELIIKEKLIPTVWGKLFKSPLAKRCNFPIYHWKEDDVFMLQYLELSNNVSIIDESLIIINCRNNSLTRQPISKKMIQDINSSYVHQYLLIKKYKEVNLESNLIKNQINTLSNLFLIIKIDWNKINDRQEVLDLFLNQIDLIEKKSRRHKIGLKKKMLLKILKSPNYFGWKASFFIIRLIKNKKIEQIKRVKL